MNLKQSGPEQRMASNILDVQTPGEIKLRSAINGIDPMQSKALEVLSELLEEANSLQVLRDEDYELYFKIIPDVMKVMKQIEPLLIQTKSEERDKKLGEYCLAKATAIGKLPDAFGIREKVKKMTAIDGFEIIV